MLKRLIESDQKPVYNMEKNMDLDNERLKIESTEELRRLLKIQYTPEIKQIALDWYKDAPKKDKKTIKKKIEKDHLNRQNYFQ